MKLSYRDKVILIILLVVLVWVIGVMFFIKPKFEDLDTANKEFDERVLVLNNKKEEIKADEDLPERVKEAYSKVTNIANNFYDVMPSDDVSELVDNLLDEDNIENDRLTISSYSSVTLNFINPSRTQKATDIETIANAANAIGADSSTDVDSKSKSDDKDSEIETGPVLVPAYTVNFGYSCKFDDFKSFIDKLRSRDMKSLVITNCTINDVNEDTISGNMTMVLMMMPRMSDPMATESADSSSGSADDASSSEAESE